MSNLSIWDQDMNSDGRVYKTFPGIITPTQAPRKIISNILYWTIISCFEDIAA